MGNFEYKDNDENTRDSALELSKLLSITEDEIEDIVNKISILDNEIQETEISKDMMINKIDERINVSKFLFSWVLLLPIITIIFTDFVKFYYFILKYIFAVKFSDFLYFGISFIVAFEIGHYEDIITNKIFNKIKQKWYDKTINSKKYKDLLNEITNKKEEIDDLEHTKSKLEKEKLDLILEIGKCNLSKKIQEGMKTVGYTIAPVVHQETSNLDSEDVKKRVRTIDNK